MRFFSPHARQIVGVSWNTFASITDYPGREGDFQGLDEVERPVQIAVVGKFLVTYWADHAVCEMRVVNIERL